MTWRNSTGCSGPTRTPSATLSRRTCTATTRSARFAPHGPMRVIALIDDPTVARRILEHLGRWVPEPAERGSPEEAPDWPRDVVIPIMYHPVPDIASRNARGRCGRTCLSHFASAPCHYVFAPHRCNSQRVVELLRRRVAGRAGFLQAVPIRLLQYALAMSLTRVSSSIAAGQFLPAICARRSVVRRRYAGRRVGGKGEA